MELNDKKPKHLRSIAMTFCAPAWPDSFWILKITTENRLWNQESITRHLDDGLMVET